MRIKRFENSVFNSNSYVIDDGSHAVIFDIGDTFPIFQYLQKTDLTPVALFFTHTHYDHIYGLREFTDRFPDVPIYTSQFGKEALRKPNWNFSRYHGDEISIDSDRIKVLEDATEVRLTKGIEVEVIATPGHDKSCLCYIMGEILVTGDSFIPGVKVVATFPNSNKTDANFWYDRLQELSTTHTVLPGHGEEMPLPNSLRTDIRWCTPLRYNRLLSFINIQDSSRTLS